MTKYEKYREEISKSIEMIRGQNKESEILLKQLKGTNKLIRDE